MDIISELEDTFIKRGGEVHRLAILEIVKRDHQIAMLHKEIEELRAAVLAEREECARVCDRYAEVCNNNSMLRDVLMGSALAIRARGET